MNPAPSAPLLFIEDDIDLYGTVVVQSTTARIEQSVTFVAPAKTAHILKATEDWGWEELRDYVATQITERYGVFPRDLKKEYGIFTSFLKRWPAHAVAIARYAFEVENGRWKGSPVSMTRFCKGSDPYFAEVIVARLTDASAV